MNTSTRIYRDVLQDRLERFANLPDAKLADLLKRFDKAASTGGEEIGFRVLINAYASASCDVESEIRTVKQLIQKALEKFNKEHSGVDKNPVSRLRAAIEKFNASLTRCGAQIRNVKGELVDALSPGELETIKVQLPKCAEQKARAYSAFASSGYADRMKNGLEFDFCR